MLSPDLQQTVSFLEWWRPGGPWVLTAIPVDRKAIETATFTDLDDARQWLDSKVSNHWNCYFSVNPTLTALRKKSDVGDIAALEWLHVDVDPEPGRDIDDERKRILAMLQDRSLGLPEPTAIVFSGGGYQAYWRLEDPLLLNGDVAKAEDAKRYNLQIELMLGADSCHNVDRIMRLPGTINWPNEKKRKKGQEPSLAGVVSRSNNLYRLSQFTRAALRQDTLTDFGAGTQETRVSVSGNVAPIDLDELPDGVDARIKVVIVQGRDPDQRLNGPDQSRSAWLMFVCGALVRAGLEDDTVYAIITNPDFGISESVLDKGNSEQVRRYAVRQIQRAKEHKIQPELAEMNDQYAVVESVGGRTRVVKESMDPELGRHDVEFLMVDGFKLTHCNRSVLVNAGQDAQGNPRLKAVQLGKWWLEHPARRTYSRVTFAPEQSWPGVLNLWRGFAYDALPGDCSLFLEHCHKVLCRGNDANYQYLLGWMARKVQRPAEPGHTAVVIHGKQGTGKGTFAKHFGRLFGLHYKHVVNPDHITGQFNTVLRDAAVVFADECFRTEKRHVSALKALITEDTLRVEAKGVDSLEMRNCTGVILATNEDWAVVAELDDRRFFVLRVGDDHRRDSRYFKAIQDQMDAGGYAALLHFLSTYSLDGFDVRDVPRTDDLRVQQRHSMSDLEEFWFQVLESGQILPSDSEWPDEVLCSQVADWWEPDRATSLHRKRTRLGIFLGKLMPGLRKVQRNRRYSWTTSKGVQVLERRPWVWVVPDLDACRAAWDREYGAQNWPEVTVAEDDGEGSGPDPF